MWSRREVMLSALGAGTLGWGLASRGARASGDGARRVLLVTALGGWDTTVALDPKRTGDFVDGPDLDEDPANADDEEAVQTLSGLDIGVNPAKRPAVTDFFTEWGHRCLLLRGLDMGTIAHLPARTRILTGLREEGGPDAAVLAADRWGRGQPLPYVDLGGAGRTGPLTAIAARTGLVGQARFLLDRSLLLPKAGGGTFPQHRTAAAFESAARSWLDAQAERVHFPAGRGRRRLNAHAEATERARELADDGPRLAGLLNDGLQRSFRAQIDSALALLSDGVAWSVAVDAGLNFDTHGNAAEQHGLHDTLFADLSYLVDGLDVAGLLDDTLVLVLSEFSRTPRRNSSGGKDHWPFTTAMLLGGGVDGGRVIGATDERVAGLPVDPATGELDPGGVVPTFPSFMAGLLEGLDVDRSQWLPNASPLGGLFA